jgi:hypothetical protein
MAIAVLRSPDGRVRRSGASDRRTPRVCLLARSRTAPSTSVNHRRPRVESPSRYVVAVNVSIFYALSLTLESHDTADGLHRILHRCSGGATARDRIRLWRGDGVPRRSADRYRWDPRRSDGGWMAPCCKRLPCKWPSSLSPLCTKSSCSAANPFQRLTRIDWCLAAVIILSVLFAVPHLFNPNSTIFAAFNTAAVGSLLGASYLLTRSLWLPWGIHWDGTWCSRSRMAWR